MLAMVITEFQEHKSATELPRSEDLEGSVRRTQQVDIKQDPYRMLVKQVNR